MSLFYSLSLAGQSLLTNKNAINITNKNISNVFTKGYSRQIPELADLPAGGVYLANVERAFSRSVFLRKVNLTQQVNGLSSYSGILEQVESLFNDVNGVGISESLNEFFSALNDVVVNPGDMSARYSVIQKAKNLVSTIRSSYDNLKQVKENSVLSVRDEVSELNNLDDKLSKLNKSIRFYQTDKERLNEYLDERDRTLESISELIDTKLTFHDDGTVDVFTAKGFSLVLFGEHSTITLETDSEGNPVIKRDGIDLTKDLGNGKIGGAVNGINYINGVIKKLNDFTSVFAAAVNKIHRQGYDLNGNTNVDFFKISSSSSSSVLDASNIDINFEDPAMFAAASDPSYVDSDNTNAKRILNLKDDISGVFTPAEESALTGSGLTIGSITYVSSPENYSFIKKKSFGEFYGSEIVAPVGLELEDVKDRYQDSNFLLDSVDQKLKEISGVNMDEELINLEKLQRAYEASARLINVTDELIKTVLHLGE